MIRGNAARDPCPGASGEHSVAELFGLLWESTADVLGTATTATLLRRALKRAATRRAELRGVEISRADFTYAYRLPEDWQRATNGAAVEALRELVRDLQALLVEMTGPVVVRRLARVLPLRCLGLDAQEE